jgi:RHS repeat-associated protein
LTGAVFVIRSQVLDSPQENPFIYGGGVSESFNLRFAGQYFDSESNLNQNYFRSYDAKQGRYTQSDPIGLGGGMNRFSYAAGNPLKYTDPTGKIVIADDLIIGGVVVTVACAATPACVKAIRDALAAAADAVGQCFTKDKDEECYQQCKHLLPSPSGDLQSSEYRQCYRQCKGTLQ